MTQPLTKQKENNNNNNKNKSSSRKSRNMSTKALGGLQGYTVRGEGRTAGEGVPGVGSGERAGWIDSTTSPQSFLWRVQVRQSKKFAALPPYFAFAFIGQQRRLATCHTINSSRKQNKTTNILLIMPKFAAWVSGEFNLYELETLCAQTNHF